MTWHDPLHPSLTLLMFQSLSQCGVSLLNQPLVMASRIESVCEDDPLPHVLDIEFLGQPAVMCQLQGNDPKWQPRIQLLSLAQGCHPKLGQGSSPLPKLSTIGNTPKLHQLKRRYRIPVSRGSGTRWLVPHRICLLIFHLSNLAGLLHLIYLMHLCYPFEYVLDIYEFAFDLSTNLFIYVYIDKNTFYNYLHLFCLSFNLTSVLSNLIPSIY